MNNNNKRSKLLKINLIISRYLLYILPTIIATVAWVLLTKENTLEKTHPVIYDLIGWNFLLWFACLIYFILSLLFYSTFREYMLTILTFSKERDERESFISGRASKATFFSTLSVLIVLFFLAGLNIQIYKKPKDEAINDKTGTITISYNFAFINKAKEVAKEAEKPKNKNEEIFIMNGIPFTQESILLFIIIFHIASYHIFTRRRLGNVI